MLFPHKTASPFPYNLQLDSLPIHVNGPDLEVDPYGRDVAFGVGVILQQAVKC